ncbi:MAG: hypothetical protein KA314_03175 [Chloroflexi bacterium]|nr:hypothetical protein [Chloroflexota bacterium]MBP8054813.1 hypothetical protein [Chloroflexota bacterium]
MPSTSSTRRRLIWFLLLIPGTVLVVALAYITGLVNQIRYTNLIIRWTTESELDVLGYNLYRADSPEGEFVQINTSLIQPSLDPLVSSEHEYVDEGRVRGRTYYYILETVDRFGNIKSRTDPIPIP